MPDFLIIGAMKCGTSSLYKYLQQHPRIDAASTKEVHFFDDAFEKGLRWYEGQFRRNNFIKRLLGNITGEATPSYIFHPLVPRRVFDSYPSIKLIALLRDPAERAYSHYQHQVRVGNETLGFEEALGAEPERTRAVTDGEGRPVFEKKHMHFSYQARGIYVDQLIRWHELFPRERMLVLFFEEMKKDPDSSIRKVTDFLGLKPYIPDTKKKHNAHKGYGPMKPETRERLAEYFRPHNLRLAEYLGRELPWDK